MDVVCIKCGKTASLKLDLADGDTINCAECDEEYTVSDVRDVIATWGKVLAWLDVHPARIEERAAAGM